MQLSKILFLLILLFPGLALSKSCQEKFEAILEEISSTRNKRWGHYSVKDQRFFDFVVDTSPGLKRSVKYSKLSSSEQLVQMHNNSSRRDIDYLLENSKLKSNFGGGEAQIFINPKNKSEALKVWRKNRMDDFELSTRAMLHYEQKITENSRLSNYLGVSKIKEKGSNYVVKEFFPRSVELKTVTNSPEVKIAVKKVKEELLKSSNIINHKLYQAITRKPPSGNLHWDPDTKKIILIDALGF